MSKRVSEWMICVWKQKHSTSAPSRLRHSANKSEGIPVKLFFPSKHKQLPETVYDEAERGRQCTANLGDRIMETSYMKKVEAKHMMLFSPEWKISL